MYNQTLLFRTTKSIESVSRKYLQFTSQRMCSLAFRLTRRWLIFSLQLSLFHTSITASSPAMRQSQLPAYTTLDPGLQLYLNSLQDSLQQASPTVLSANVTTNQKYAPPAELPAKYYPPVSAPSSATSTPHARRQAPPRSVPVFKACTLPQSFAMSTYHIFRIMKSMLYATPSRFQSGGLPVLDAHQFKTHIGVSSNHLPFV